jgi:hypothetical protein
VSAYIAKLQLKERVKSFKARQKEMKASSKIEGIETLLFKYKYSAEFSSKKRSA